VPGCAKGPGAPPRSVRPGHDSHRPRGPVGEFLDLRFSLTGVDSGQAIEVKSLGGAQTFAWVPLEPLEANTTYEANVNLGYESVPDTIWEFTTGTVSTPALALEGKLEVSLERGTDTIYPCPAVPCGSIYECAAQEVTVTKARVKLPRASGGFPARVGQLWLTDNQPFDFTPDSKMDPAPYRGQNVSLVEFVDLDDASVTEVLITVPAEDAPYQPCFAFAASDLRGDQAMVEAVCLPGSTAPEEDAGGSESGGSDAAAADSAATEPAAVNPATPSNSASCNVARGGASGGACWAALGLLAFAKRRSLRQRLVASQL
jgi:hypothetical protein